MRVFVVGTGRCGSVSFRNACGWITNFTSGHESLCGFRNYPDNHIEVNPHLRLSIVSLTQLYPDALFVHLLREPDSCIDSIAALGHGSVVNAYRTLHPSVVRSLCPADVAFTYYWDANDTINALLSYCVSERRRRLMKLEVIKDQWKDFWEWIGAEGDFESSLKSWDTPANTRAERGE